MKRLSDINLDLLRVFVRVATRPTMLDAARSLFVTQSAVSHAISELERILDCRLFDRTRRKLELTSEGRTLLEIAQEMFAVLRTGHEKLADVKSRRTGLLRVGCPFLLMQSFLTPAFADFHEESPEVRVSLKVENRMQPMLDLLRNDSIDLLFLATPEAGEISPEFAEETLGTYRYAFYGSRRRYAELAGRTVTLEEVNRHPIIVLKPGNNTRDYLEMVFARDGLAMNVAIEAETMAVTQEFTKAGFGLGAMLMPEAAGICGMGDELFALDTGDALPGGRYVALSRKGAVMSEAAASFMDMVRKRLVTSSAS